MTFGYIATFSSQNGILTAIWWHKKKIRLLQFSWAQTVIYVKDYIRHTDDLSVAKGLNLPDLIVSLLWLLKTHSGNKTFFFFFFFFSFFAHNVIFGYLWLLNFGLLLNFRDVTVTLSQNVLIFVLNTSQLIGLVHFIIKDWNYLAFWKKLALNQVLRF